MTTYERIKLKNQMENTVHQISDFYNLIEKYDSDLELSLDIEPLIKAKYEIIVNNYTKLKEEGAL